MRATSSSPAPISGRIDQRNQSGARGWLAEGLAALGRVPLFFYLAHLPFVHALAAVLGAATGRGMNGLALWVVYAVWLAALAALYPLCRWYAGVKRRCAGGHCGICEHGINGK